VYQKSYEKARNFVFIPFYSNDIIPYIRTVLTYSTLKLCIIETAYSAVARWPRELSSGK